VKSSDRARHDVLASLVGSRSVRPRPPDPPLIRFGHGFAAESRCGSWRRGRISRGSGHEIPAQARLVPGQSRTFRPTSRASSTRTAPGLAVIFARAQGLDIRSSRGSVWKRTAAMVHDGVHGQGRRAVKSVKDLKGGTGRRPRFKTATNLWVRAARLNAGPFPTGTSRSCHPLSRPWARRCAGQSEPRTFVEPFYSAEVAKGGPADALHRGQGGRATITSC